MAAQGEWRSLKSLEVRAAEVSNDCSDDDARSVRRASNCTESSSCINDYQSSDDEYTCKSTAGEENFDSIDYRAYQYVNKYLDFDTRLSRTPRKSRDRETHLKQKQLQANKHSANSSRRTSRDNQQYPAATAESDQQQMSDGGGETGSDGQKKTEMHKRKRSNHQLRASERDAKFEVVDSVVDGQAPCSSLALAPAPSAPQQESVKIDLPNPFRSLNSRPVVPKEPQTSGTVTPLRPPSQECPKDRADFYEIFSLLIRIGNHERKPAEDRTFARQRSQEEQIWQNKLNDVVWLELRAWHNGRSPEKEDHALCNERERIHPILKEIMEFKFVPRRKSLTHSSPSTANESLFSVSVSSAQQLPAIDDVLLSREQSNDSTEGDASSAGGTAKEPEQDGLQSSDVRLLGSYPAKFSIEEKANGAGEYTSAVSFSEKDGDIPANASSFERGGVDRRNDRPNRRLKLDLFKAKQGDGSPGAPGGVHGEKIARESETASASPRDDWDSGYPCGGLCNVFCPACLANQNDALGQVETLLEKLEDVGRLYPSSRAMAKHWPEVSTLEFNDRVKTMCLFFNMVTDLRQKIVTLGKLLASLGGKTLPWPSFDSGCPFERLFVTEPLVEEMAEVTEEEADVPEDDGAVDGSVVDDGKVLDELCDEQRVTIVEGSDDGLGNKCVRFRPECVGSSVLLVPRAPSENSLMQASMDSGIGLMQPSSSSGSSTPSGNLTPNPWNRQTKLGGPEGEVAAGGSSDDPPWTWNSAGQRRSPITAALASSIPVTECGQPASPAPSCSSITGAVFNRSLSELSVDSSLMPPYRRYVDKLLKQKGLRKLMQRLTQLIQNTLFRARYSLEKRMPPPVVNSPDLAHFNDDPILLPMSQSDSEHTKWESEEWCNELSNYGVWGEYYSKMGLPSFRALYLFLLQIPLEIMHECLKLRLEQQPEDPSFLSIRQLMRECKEAIKASVIIRQKYFRMNRVVLLKHELDKLEQNLTDFDDNVKLMLQSYLRYLQSWVQMLLKSPQQTQKNVLEEEWTFVKVFSRYVQRGEALASELFCSMASNMLASSGHYLETELDSCTSTHYDRLASDQDILTPTSNRRHNILLSCRNFKDVFHETRKRALKAIAFSKMLRKDLEIAAEFSIETCVDSLLDKLQSTNHIRLIAPHSSNFIIFIPEHIKDNRPYLGQLLSMTYGHEHSAAPDNAKSEGYLIILCCNNCGDFPGRWRGLTQAIEPTAEITITLSQLSVEGLLLVVNHSSQLGMQRKIFQKAMGSNVRVTKEFTSCNQSIADSLMDLKKEALNLRDKITDVISTVESDLNMDSIGDLDESSKANLQSSCRELLHQCYKFGFEYQKEITRLVTGESRCQLGPGLILFANNWMRFVSHKCERGRGVRPRWANQGLDFLMTACEPVYLKHLTESDFVTLKMNMNECITHLIGSPETRTSHGGGPGSRSHSPTPHSRSNYRHSASYEPVSQFPRSVSTVSSKSEPTPTKNLFGNWNVDTEGKGKRNSKEYDPEVSESALPIDHVRRAIFSLEKSREATLQNEGMIGRARDVSVETTVQISARRVTFNWQRGFKIGQGRFGKVYAAVNSNGDLMALKEIHLQPNDHKTIKDVADELRIFEGIRHPYLVRYYGVEIHREEMFIFMEFCSCGTLENAAQLSLPEALVRKYTRQLLEAVNVLHEHGIVHRDIKGANIFLTADGNLKLGDFGCCIKLKNHTTMPGELNSFVGTQAFMAPEVFTKSVTEGHGRAADIWSVGCVVIEMVTGKRPWHELENNYQIMFKVGTGAMPEIPSTLSEEGQDFLSHCFQFEPKDRWTASRLLDSPFTKVDSEDEFQSITFLPEVCQQSFGEQ